MDGRSKIQKIYYLLIGIEKSVTTSQNEKFVSTIICERFNSLMYDLRCIINDDMLDYFVIEKEEFTGRNLTIGEMKNHICPIIELLKNFYIDDGEYHIAKIGSLYNSIDDKDIKERCGDILLGDSAFDRAINQATQILEDRIKKKAGLDDTNLIGLPLISKAVHPKIEETILKFSDKADIQEGYSFLFKGLISNYRNPTHHTLSFECSREYALKVCAYIDELLKIVDNSEKIK